MATPTDPNKREVPSLLPAMLGKGLGIQMDKIVEELVYENKERIHEIVDLIIAKRNRTVGKGQKSSSGGSSGGPGYTNRNPKLDPECSVAAIKKTQPYIHPFTRSTVDEIGERQPAIASIEFSRNKATAECREVVQAIIAECTRRNAKFFDDSFYFDKRENLYPEGTPEDCTVTEPRLARRLSEIFPQGRLFDAAGINVDDANQGGVGNCFFIGALDAASSALYRSDALELLFVEHSTQWGVYGMVFYKQGGWEWVIVDDFIAVKKGRSSKVYPLYCAPSKMDKPEEIEFWPMILEKSYAKLHYNWDTIDGGFAKEALADLTGGIEFTLDLYKNEMMWQQFKKLAEDPQTILCCSLGSHVKSTGGAAGGNGEAAGVNGLFHGHQYSVTQVCETSDGGQFLQVRNPWGGDFEWTGRYSDHSSDWVKNPKHKAELRFQEKDDGMFFMLWEDFRRVFTNIEGIRNFPDDYFALSLYGKAVEAPTEDNAYFLEIRDKECELTIVIEQDDPKVLYDSSEHDLQKNKPYAALSFLVGSLPKMPKNITDFQSIMMGTKRSPKQAARTVHLTQSFTAGCYGIVPLVGSTKLYPFAYALRVIGPGNSNYRVWKMTDGHDNHYGCGVFTDTSAVAAVVSASPSLVVTPRNVSGTSGTKTSLPRECVVPVMPKGKAKCARPGAADQDTISPCVSAGAFSPKSKAAAPVFRGLIDEEEEEEEEMKKAVLKKAAPRGAAPAIGNSSDNTGASGGKIRRLPGPLGPKKAKTAPPSFHGLGECEAEAVDNDAEKAAAELKSVKDELEDARAYIARLEEMLEQKQAQVDTLTTSAQNLVAKRKPLERLGFDSARFDASTKQVFVELARGGTTITQSQALSGFRLVVTLGAGLDDTFHEACATAGIESNQCLSLSQFARRCLSTVDTWGPLQP